MLNLLGYGQDVSERLAGWAALRVSRGELLRRGGQTAAAVGMGFAFLEIDTSTAFAHGACNWHACGPSPLCSSGDCFQADCSGSCSSRAYGTYNCGSFGQNQWCETCSSGTWTGYWICGDCCCSDGTGNTCQGSCGGRACICRYEKSSIGTSQPGCCNDCQDHNSDTGPCAC